MRRLVLIVPILAIASAWLIDAAAAKPSSAEDFDSASKRVLTLVEAVMRVEGVSPAIGVVMVRRGQAPVVWVRGRLDARAEGAVNGDTPFYIASQTKAFVGLMALRLHARGIFSLDQSLTDVWPGLTLPAGADPRSITFAQLLSHQGVIENGALAFRTSETDFVPAKEYPQLLSVHSTIRDPGFEYSNVGYLIYGAALETRTGRDWRDWLDAEIFVPARMTRSGSRPSRFHRQELPRHHQWLGGRDWVVHQGKPDDLMHAAGGLNVSPADMARWLSLQLGEAPHIASLDLLAQQQAPRIKADITTYTPPCQSYGVGWNLCRIAAADIRVHGGGYTAVRSIMAVSPELGVGFAFFSNSDSLTGYLGQTLNQTFFEAVQNPSYQGPKADAFAADMAARLQKLVQDRKAAVSANRAESRWGGWAFTPDEQALRAFVGRYRNAALGEFVITLRQNGLRGAIGVRQRELQPARPNLFAMQNGPLDPPEPVAFDRQGDRVVSLTWNDERFDRMD